MSPSYGHFFALPRLPYLVTRLGADDLWEKDGKSDPVTRPTYWVTEGWAAEPPFGAYAQQASLGKVSARRLYKPTIHVSGAALAQSIKPLDLQNGQEM